MRLKAVVMAGGEGTRLRPLTCGLPKPMVPVGNRPILEHVLNLLARHGCEEALLTLHARPQIIRDYVGDGSAFGLRAKCFVEDVPLGTAGSVKNVEADLDDTFVVISGDVLTGIDLSALMAFHRRQGAAVTIGLTTVENPLEYGVVVCDKNGRVNRFLEKPSWGEVLSDQVSTGIYVIEPAVLKLIELGRVCDFSQQLFPALLEAGMPIFGYRSGDYWCDVGNLGQYLQAHFDILEGRTGLDIGGSELREKVWAGPGVDIAPGVVIEGPLLLGPAVYVGSGASIEGPAVIGRGVIVGGQATIKRSVIGDHSYIGRLAEVRGAVLGRGVRLHNRSSVYDGAVLADEVRVGEEATVKPNVKVWPGRSIAPETILGDSLVWGQTWGYGVFGESGVTGAVNVDLRPELVARLGAVFGASLPAGEAVVVGADPSPAARLLRDTLVSGLGLAGCAVWNGGELPAVAVRYAVTALRARGGVHLGIPEGSASNVGGGSGAGGSEAAGSPLGSDGTLIIRFFDGDGLDLARSATRKLERALGGEDFRRASPERLLPVRYLPGVGEAYLAHIEDRGRNLARKGLVVAGSYRHPWLRTHAANLWRALDVGHVALEPFGDLAAGATGLARRLREAGAAFAFQVGPTGETLSLLDNLGRPLSPAQVWLVLSAAPLARDATPLVVPSNLPRAVAERLAALGAHPISCRATRPELMARMRDLEKDAGPGLFRQSEMVFDALMGAVGLLDYLADTGETLSEMVDQSPLGEWVHLRVACPWEVKGRVMRLLLEGEAAGTAAASGAAGATGVAETAGVAGTTGGTPGATGWAATAPAATTPAAAGWPATARAVEGLQAETPKGRALVLPDADRPAFHVYSEAATMEAAEELAGFYAGRVRELAGLETDTGIPTSSGQS